MGSGRLLVMWPQTKTSVWPLYLKGRQARQGWSPAHGECRGRCGRAVWIPQHGLGSARFQESRPVASQPPQNWTSMTRLKLVYTSPEAPHSAAHSSPA